MRVLREKPAAPPDTIIVLTHDEALAIKAALDLALWLAKPAHFATYRLTVAQSLIALLTKELA